MTHPNQFNIAAIVQGGRLQYEAIIFAATLRQSNPDLQARLILLEPQPGPLWRDDPRVDSDDVRRLLGDLGAEIIPFENRHFGSDYPYGNKIEALTALPKGEPFVFFDTDTLFTGDIGAVPFDFTRPTASLRREDTWPKIEIYGPGYGETWRALYDKFELDFDGSLDTRHPDEYWERYLYFNAGFFFYRCPHEFGELFLRYALAIRDDPPPELVCQSLDPWLDLVALPLVIHALGGGRDTLPAGLLDGTVSTHWRVLPLFYARESDEAVAALQSAIAPNKIKKVIKAYDPVKKMVFHGHGTRVRALFDRDNLPKSEQKIRNRIKRNNLWVR